MSKTKEKIFISALKLFNEHGLSSVTLRTISVDIGISQGNLNYHFKKRDDIIEGLYFRLVSEINDTMVTLKNEGSSLAFLFTITESIMKLLYKYRFFMLDFSHIMKGNDSIRAYHKDLNVLRQSQIDHIFQLMISEGMMKPESFDKEYFLLYKRTQILIDFWISSAQIEFDQISENSIPQYLNLIAQSIYPYLTNKGKTVFCELI